LHPSIGSKLKELQHLISQFSVFRQVPQIEVSVTDNITALVFRHLAPLSEKDKSELKRFEVVNNVDIYLQPGGLDSVIPLSPDQTTPLSYRLPNHDIELIFWPTDFTQVNHEINVAMVDRVIELLAPDSGDHILDLFCGLGNFALPLARRSALITGVESDTSLIERARFNVQHNGIDNSEFHVANLADKGLQASFLQQDYQKILIDPPRTGAEEIINNLKLNNVQRIVYVSCNPATLARDSGILVKEKGFHLQQAGVMDMFPHTTHVESIALFEK